METRQFLVGTKPGIATYHGKMSLFDNTADDPDIETGSSHQTSANTLDASACTASRTPLYKSAYVNLNDDLLAESECKTVAWREEQREEESHCKSTSMVAGHTKEGLVTSYGEIL